jgi:hypothetical protein
MDPPTQELHLRTHSEPGSLIACKWPRSCQLRSCSHGRRAARPFRGRSRVPGSWWPSDDLLFPTEPPTPMITIAACGAGDIAVVVAPTAVLITALVTLLINGEGAERHRRCDLYARGLTAASPTPRCRSRSADEDTKPTNAVPSAPGLPAAS